LHRGDQNMVSRVTLRGRDFFSIPENAEDVR
jgi:hypothetical protein